ncbi:sugar ABC transporter permease [Deinococcus sp. YIM 134068]|uniref:carbohydrate ABC transporter permease n=1 Tax=Deinococcus lichenicola TaxID=3118910 RepID=UPI002F942983
MQRDLTPPTAATLRPARRRRPGGRDELAFWTFVGPLVLGLVAFILVPMGWGLLLSFSEARASIDLGRWVGWENYRTLLADPGYLGALKTAVIFAVFIVPTTFFLSLGLAMLVNSTRIGRAFFRSVFFLPTAVSYVVASLIWKLGLFSGVSFGIANKALLALGLDTIAWTSSLPWVWVALISVRLWLQIGFNMLLFIAGLNEIPASLYEAAKMEGAERGWAVFRFITLPMLRNTSVFVLFTTVVAGFQSFDEFYNVLGSVNGGSSAAAALGARPPLWYLYDTAFASQDYGQATAGAFILTALILVVALVQSRIVGLGRATDE